jgi:putative surface cell wall-binding protein
MTSTRPTIALHRAIALALAGAALVSLFLAAKAEANNDKTYFTVTAGALEFVTAPALPVLTGVTLNGEAQTTHTNMTNFRVKDARGTGAGWHVSVSSRATVGTTVSEKFKEYCESASVCGANAAERYVSGGKELEANALTLNSTSATFSPSDANVPTYTAECLAGCTVDTPEGSPHKVVSALANKGMGKYETVFNNAEPHGLMLATPMNLATLPNANEVYRVDVVWTLATLP